jgi:hypothetical protein
MTRIIIEIDGREASSIILQPTSTQGAQSELAPAALRTDMDAGAAPTGVTAFAAETAAVTAVSQAIDAGPSRERRAVAAPAKRSARRK